MKSNLKLLVLMKNTPWTKLAEKYLRDNFSEINVLKADRKEDIDAFNYSKRYPLYGYDWIISFICPWIIPKNWLEDINYKAINFHPGPPEYPGTGCYNFAIYEGAEQYGVTCHYMIPEVDAGGIIRAKRFPISPTITVEALKNMTMVHLLSMFYYVMAKLKLSQKLDINGEIWAKKATKRVDLQKLCKLLVPLDDVKETERRLRACYFPGALDSPHIVIAGKKWRLEPI